MRHYQRRPRVHPPYRVDTTRPVRDAVQVTGRDPKSPEQARLAAAVLAARERLRITQEEFAERSGLALKTIQRIEKGQITPRTKTFAGLDQGAGWQTGSASACFRDGSEPALLSDLEPITALGQLIVKIYHELVAEGRHPEDAEDRALEIARALKQNEDALSAAIKRDRERAM